MSRYHRFFVVLVAALLAAPARPAPQPAVAAPPLAPPPPLPSPAESVYAVGVARVDITPRYSIRLSGFGVRRAESEGVTQPIWAKALAIGADADGPAVLITVDNLGIPDAMVEEVAGRLRKHGVRRDRLAVTASHTHTAPMLRGVAPTLFGVPIPPAHQEHIARYTRELTDKLTEVAQAALQDRAPARLFWGNGWAKFARNRRPQGGPVDHDLPLLVVKDLAGKVRAVYVSYACHCVTLAANKVSGDWAGFAQDQIERRHPGAVALVSIGCGADQNPSARAAGDKIDVPLDQGTQIAQEVDRLLQGYLAPVTGPLVCRRRCFDLALDDLPTRAQWEARAKQPGAVGYHARVQLERLDQGNSLPTKVAYSVQTWRFGDQLAMVFLPGEVVVDYALRLKRELDPGRLWVNAYSNDAPCYIPSERVLKEGGYEGGDAMIYYDKPTRFRTGLEDQIVRAVHSLLPASFAAPFDAAKLQGTRPLSPQQSLATLRTHEDLTIELVAAEPLVTDPVAIDFGPDGRLWVCEMCDYPSGVDGRLRPGGRIKVLEDTDGDGRYDKATVFLDHIPFPTGVTVWRKGVLVCAAPDILYAEDTDGDGKADVVRKLYSGFATHNYQARVNGLAYGLDNWVHGSGGLFGGEITSFAGGVRHLTNRDFRCRPDTGEIEPAAGRAQQGRVRNDWGDWFGCDNSNLVRHYPLADRYLRRNPFLAPPANDVYVPDYPDSTLLYPARSDLQLFKLSGPPGRVTSACGIGVYRDDLLGEAYAGDTFTCEPVNLLVHRLKLTPKQSTFSGRRAGEEVRSEFLAGTDNWFRPVQARTGPDGALWVVDMYRLVIEHPQWIPPEDLAKVDVRAGHTRGRIYRVYPRGRKPRPVPRLDRLGTAGLVAALDSPNGPQRDLAQQMLLWKQDRAAVGPLERVARESRRPQARLHALCTLDGLGALRPNVLEGALGDAHPGVRRHAVRLAEGRLGQTPALGAAVLRCANDADAQIRLQLACSLGEWDDPRAARALAELARRGADDPYLLAAVQSSVNRRNMGDVVAVLLSAGPESARLVTPMIRLAAAMGDGGTLKRVLAAVVGPGAGRPVTASELEGVSALLEGLERRGQRPDDVLGEEERKALGAVVEGARRAVADPRAAEEVRVAAVGVLGGGKGDVRRLGEQLVPQNPAALQSAVVAALGRLKDDAVPDELLPRWAVLSPGLRAQVLDVLLSRPAWQRRLLGAVERGEVPAAQIDAGRRRLLLENKDGEVRALAARVLAGSVNRDRQKVVEEYGEVTKMPGDRARGKAVFARRCATCHLLEGVGHAVGPDLGSMANKSPAALLIAVLDPNQAVDSRYLHYVAVTKDGRMHNGVLAAEASNAVTLLGEDGKEETLLRSDLDEFYSTGKSLMPEGLEKDLGKADLADLIAYLTAAGPPAKEVPGNRPAVVRPAAGGTLRLAADEAEIYGGNITFEGEFKNIGFWHGGQDYVAWSLRPQKPGRYDVYLDYACDRGSAGNGFVVEAGDGAIRGKADATGGWDKYQRRKVGTLALAAGPQRLVVRPDGKVSGALFDLRTVLLVPEGTKP